MMRIDRNLPFYIHTVRGLTVADSASEHPLGVWVRAIAMPYPYGKLRAAWWVLTGRAYAFRWPEPGDLEHALGIFPDIPKPEPKAVGIFDD